jgi:hypothetical protein
MDVFCGIDWAEDHHDIAVVDRDGRLLARRRIGDDAAGLAQLLNLLAGLGDTAEDPVPAAIETPRGLLTACLRATGRPVYPVNPMAVARYRDRHSVAGRKSDLLTELRGGLGRVGGWAGARVATVADRDRRRRCAAGSVAAGGAAGRVG